MAWSTQSAAINAAALKQFGEPVVYQSVDGGPSVSTTAIIGQPTIEQSTSPGYFADVEVDPVVITNPQRDDQITWADGVVYIVGRVVAPPYGLTKLALHRLADPTGIDLI